MPGVSLFRRETVFLGLKEQRLLVNTVSIPREAPESMSPASSPRDPDQAVSEEDAVERLRLRRKRERSTLLMLLFALGFYVLYRMLF